VGLAVLRNILRLCVQVPESLLAKSYADVAAYLTENARNDLDKIRAIFRWTASLDLAALQSRTTELPEPGTPLDYLLRINWRMGNHANFIMHMARYVSAKLVLTLACNISLFIIRLPLGCSLAHIDLRLS